MAIRKLTAGDEERSRQAKEQALIPVVSDVTVEPPYPRLEHAKTAEELSAFIPFLSLDEVAALKTLARRLPPNPKIVNIGAGIGTSVLSFFEVLEDFELWSVDIQEEGKGTGSLEGERDNVRRAGYIPPVGALPPHYHQIHGDSKAVGEAWDGPKLDLCFIDGDHQYQAVKDDIAAWLPHVKDYGLLVFHDYEEIPATWYMVWRAVEEMIVPHYVKVLHIRTLAAFLIRTR